MTVATLAGVALDGSNAITWEQITGTDPGVALITLERKRAQAIFDASGGEPVSMQLGERRIDGLYVTSLGPGGGPNTRTLVVKDQRWLWQQTLLHCVFNKRVRTPLRRLRGEGDPVNRPVTPDFIYASYSLNAGQAWTLQDAIANVLDQLKALHGTVYTLPAIKRALPLEDFQETTNAADVMSRLLGYATGYELVVRDDGTVTLTDTHENGESTEIARAGPIAVGTGWVEKSDRRYERPRWVDVYYLPEHELRFDFLEGQSLTAEDRRLVNVIKVPDRELEINGERVAEGSYVPIEDYFTAVNPLVLNGIQMSTNYLADNYLRTVKIEGDFLRDRNAAGFVDLLWAERVKAILSSWRRDFEIPAYWKDRLQGIKAQRVSIVYAPTKTPAEAQVFTQWSAWPTERSIYQHNRSQSFASGWFKDGYATLLSAARPTRAEVTVKSPQAGVFRVFLLKDALSEAAMIVPGLPRNDEINTIVPSGSRGAGAARILLQKQTKLARNYKLAIVLTGVKAARDRRQLFSVRVPFALARDVAGIPDQPALGPPVSIFITPGATTTARFAWDDARAEDIDESFRTGAADPIELTSINPSTPIAGRLGDLLVNSDAVSALALGAAASVYSRIVDRLEGKFAALQVPGRAGPQVAGAIASVRTTVTSEGIVAEELSLPRILKGIDALSGVPSAIRQRLLGLLEAP